MKIFLRLSFASASMLLAGCENLDLTGMRPGLRPVETATAPEVLPGVSPQQTGSIAPPAPTPRRIVETQAAARSRGDVQYTTDGRVVLPINPSPPVIDLGENSAALIEGRAD